MPFLNTNTPLHLENFLTKKVAFSMFPCLVGRGGFNTPYRPIYPFTPELTSYTLDSGKDEEEQMAVNVRVRGELASQKKDP